MLNLLVSSTLLRLSMHNEKLFNKDLFILIVVLAIASLLIGMIWVVVGDEWFTVGMIPPLCFCVIALCVMMFVNMDGVGTYDISAHQRQYDDNYDYQYRMLHNNNKIKHYKKQSQHYEHLLNDTNTKEKISEYGYKEQTAKYHINTLRHYNNLHQDKAYLPSIEQKFQSEK